MLPSTASGAVKLLPSHWPPPLSGETADLWSFLCVLHLALRAIAGHPAFHFTCTQPWSELSAWMTPRSEELENSHLSPETQLAASHADSRSAGTRSTCWQFALMQREGLACVAHRPVTGTSPLSSPVGLAAAVVSPSQPLTVQRPSHSGKSRSHYSLANTFLYHNSACTRLQGPPLGSFPSFLP